MEHAVSASTLDRFIEFMEFIQFCPRVGLDWLKYFDEYRLHGQGPDKCLYLERPQIALFRWL